ncbi:hypothetical protein GCM10027085_10200 [Spirosoma aerophilum]
MAKLTKLLLTLSMVLVWGWTIFMGTFATHAHGRLAGWIIGLVLNVLLGLVYSYQTTHPKTIKEWFKR